MGLWALPNAASMPVLGPGRSWSFPALFPILYLRCPGSVPGLQSNGSFKVFSATQVWPPGEPGESQGQGWEQTYLR